MLDVVNAKDIRPLTDKVSAVPPEVETYDIEIVYYTTPESEAEVIANVEGTGARSTATTSGKSQPSAGTSTPTSSASGSSRLRGART